MTSALPPIDVRSGLLTSKPTLFLTLPRTISLPCGFAHEALATIATSALPPARPFIRPTIRPVPAAVRCTPTWPVYVAPPYEPLKSSTDVGVGVAAVRAETAPTATSARAERASAARVVLCEGRNRTSLTTLPTTGGRRQPLASWVPHSARSTVQSSPIVQCAASASRSGGSRFSVPP